MRQGFTLIELLVVIALISITTGLAAPAFVRSTSAPNDTAAELRAAVRSARRLAADSGRTTWVRIRASDSSYWLIQRGRSGPVVVGEGRFAHTTLMAPYVVNIGLSPSGYAYGESLRIAARRNASELTIMIRNGELVRVSE